MNEPTVVITGNVGGDVQLRYTPQAKAVASFSLASTPRRKDGDKWVDGETWWVPVTVWGEYAERVMESVEKGCRVVVTGRLAWRSWEKDGETRGRVELTADEVAVSLRYATATVQKATRSGGDPAGHAPAADDPWAGHPADSEPPF